jgi:alpha-acetolactate decarboxylase
MHGNKRMSTALDRKRNEVFDLFIARNNRGNIKLQRQLARAKGGIEGAIQVLEPKLKYPLGAIRTASSIEALENIKELVVTDALRDLTNEDMEGALKAALMGPTLALERGEGAGGSGTPDTGRPPSSGAETVLKSTYEKDIQEEKKKYDMLFDAYRDRNTDVAECKRENETLKAENGVLKTDNLALREKALGAGSKVSGDMVPKKKHDNALDRILRLEDKNRQLEAENKALGKSVGEKVGRGITFDNISGETKTGEILPDERLVRLEKGLRDSEAIREKIQESRDRLATLNAELRQKLEAAINKCDSSDERTESIKEELLECETKRNELSAEFTNQQRDDDEAITELKNTVNNLEHFAEQDQDKIRQLKDEIDEGLTNQQREDDEAIKKLREANRGIRQKLQGANTALELAQQETNTIYEAVKAGEQGEENNKLRIEIDALKNYLEQVNQALEECEDGPADYTEPPFDFEDEDDDFDDLPLDFRGHGNDRSSARRQLEYPKGSDKEGSDSDENHQRILDDLGIVDSDDSEATTPLAKIQERMGQLPASGFKAGDVVSMGGKLYIVRSKDGRGMPAKKNPTGDYSMVIGGGSPKVLTSEATLVLSKEDNEKKTNSLTRSKTSRSKATSVNTGVGRKLPPQQLKLRVMSYEGVAGEIPALPLLRIPEPHEL